MAIQATQQDDTISLKMPHNIVEALNNIAQREDRSRSSLIRKLIISYIEEYEDLKDAKEGRIEYEKNPKIALNHNEVLKALGIKK